MRGRFYLRVTIREGDVLVRGAASDQTERRGLRLHLPCMPRQGGLDSRTEPEATQRKLDDLRATKAPRRCSPESVRLVPVARSWVGVAGWAVRTLRVCRR